MSPRSPPPAPSVRANLLGRTDHPQSDRRRIHQVLLRVHGSGVGQRVAALWRGLLLALPNPKVATRPTLGADKPSYQTHNVNQYLTSSPSLPQSHFYNRDGRAIPDISALGVGNQRHPREHTDRLSLPAGRGFLQPVLRRNCRVNGHSWSHHQPPQRDQAHPQQTGPRIPVSFPPEGDTLQQRVALRSGSVVHQRPIRRDRRQQPRRLLRFQRFLCGCWLGPSDWPGHSKL